MKNLLKKCKPCQLHSQVSHRPTTEMILVLNPCLFFQWDIDLLGPFPKSKNQARYIVIAVDYATKWIEAKPLAKIREKEMIEFLMEVIIFRFGVPRILVTENIIQFVGEKFTNVLLKLRIKHIKAFVAYPQANGQVEVSNRTIMQGLKKRVEEFPRCWVDELANVLWAYTTTPRSTTCTSPFKMTYIVEVVWPVEVILLSSRVEYFNPEGSSEGLHFYNTLVEEIRDKAAAKVRIQQSKIALYFNKKVKVKHFLVNDLVLRESATSPPSKTGKLKAPWEGPYSVAKVMGPKYMSYHSSTASQPKTHGMQYI